MRLEAGHSTETSTCGALSLTLQLEVTFGPPTKSVWPKRVRRSPSVNCSDAVAKAAWAFGASGKLATTHGERKSMFVEPTERIAATSNGRSDLDWSRPNPRSKR